MINKNAAVIKFGIYIFAELLTYANSITSSPNTVLIFDRNSFEVPAEKESAFITRASAIHAGLHVKKKSVHV